MSSPKYKGLAAATKPRSRQKSRHKLAPGSYRGRRTGRLSRVHTTPREVIPNERISGKNTGLSFE